MDQGILKQLNSTSSSSAIWRGTDSPIVKAFKRPAAFATLFETDNCSYASNNQSDTFNYGGTYRFKTSNFGEAFCAAYLQIDLQRTDKITNEANMNECTNALGLALIENLRVKFGGDVLFQFIPEQLYIYHVLMHPTDKHADELIGKFGTGINTNDRRRLAGLSARNIRFYIKIPLQSSFTAGHLLRDRIHQSLPIISANLADYEFEVQLASDKFMYHRFANGGNTSTNYDATYSPKIVNIRLITEKLFFDSKYKEELANQVSHQLIEEVAVHTQEVLAGSTSTSMTLDLSSPVRELIWVYRQNQAFDGVSETKIHRFDFRGKEHYPGTSLLNSDNIENNTFVGNAALSSFTDNRTDSYYGHSKNDAFVEAHICFGPVLRSKQDALYHRVIEPRHHHSNVQGASDNFIYCYSFSYDPEDLFNSTGAIETAPLPNITIKLTHQQTTVAGKIIVLARCMNLIRTGDGYLDKLFSSSFSC